MEKDMKAKFKTLLGIFGLLCISQMAFAATDSSSSGSSKPRKPMYREITPNAGPRVAYGYDIFLTADFIYWKAKQSGMSYATTGILTQAPAAPFEPLENGHDAQVKYDWDPGFKAGAGLNFWHDGWDIYIEYTWLHTDGSDSIARPNGVIPAFTLPPNVIDGDILNGNSARSKGHLHFNVIDLELGRNFYISQFLMLRPHVGFKGTWQNQDWRTRYDSNDLQLRVQQGNPIPLSGPYRMHHHNIYYGVGFRTGIDMAWHFTTNWSIFGDVSWTAMWSRYRLVRHDTVDDDATGEKQRNMNTRSNFFDVKFIGEFQIGLRFEMWFADDRYHFQIQAGWEEQVWINHMTFINGISPSPFFDLTTQGGTAMVRFD
ncbi:MAG: autotransporter outer membrane beta-barrel domain-containing protein, partial [Simkania sp.]|nr:autotransporter outer membrane beta-barrel domain-containing protein [Simkania sp.]